MCGVIIQTEEPFSIREFTESMVKNLYNTYTKVDLEQVASNTTQLNSENRTKLIFL